jgi:predicted small secreted protein
MDVCDKMGNGDCNRVLGSFIELNPRFIQEENDTNYVYRGAGSEGSSIVKGSIVRTLSIIFEPNQVNATSDLYVVIPLSGGIAGYGGYYDLADISFLLVSRGTVPPALQVRFVESSAAASFDNITQSWSVTMEGQYDGEENVNITAVYALTANGTVNNLIWKGVSPIGGSPMSSPFSVSPYSTFVILVSVSASQGFVHGQLVEFMITDSAGHSGAWSLSLP